MAARLLLFLLAFLVANAASNIARAQDPGEWLKSRWAMSDPKYAEKYAEGVSKTDIAGKVKQASDARFVKQTSGFYGSAGITQFSEVANPMGSLEIGYTGYWTSYLTNRVGLILAANDDDFFTGAEVGMRFQTPTRLAPFAGVGLFVGGSSVTKIVDDDEIDNDDDGSIDELGEEEQTFDGGLSGIYPETGIHFWWTPRIRISGFGRYLITSEGRSSDAWYFGSSIAFLSH